MQNKKTERFPNFSLLSESTKEYLVIKDIGPWHIYPTITNSAEEVVEFLYKLKLLFSERKLLYYDSENQLDEIIHKDGKFVCFKPFKFD